jgi:glycosyltransferase involved in cell wall biosynthesis
VLLRGILDSTLGHNTSLAQRPRVFWQCLAGLALADMVRSEHVDHVHAHMANTPTGVAMYAAMALGVPFSFTGHAADLFRYGSLLEQKLRSASFVACISEWHRDYYKRRATLDDTRLPIIRCGVEVDRELDTEARDGGILAIGRLVPKKGFDVLIEALARLPETLRPNVTIIGDGPERAALEKLVQSLLGPSARVAFRGALPNSEVLGLLRRTSLCVLPCRVGSDGDQDGIPVALMEAMAEGVPVITSDLPTLRELVRNGESGTLVRPDDPEALAGALRELLEHPEQRARLGSGGRARVIEEFAIEPNLDRLLNAFFSVRKALPCAS